MNSAMSCKAEEKQKDIAISPCQCIEISNKSKHDTGEDKYVNRNNPTKIMECGGDLI